MHSRSAVLSRAVLVGVEATWCVVAVTIGLLAVLEWPSRFQVRGRWLPILGLCLLAVGQFMSAMVADRLFPGASRRLTAVLELAPWVVLAVIVIGGSV